MKAEKYKDSIYVLEHAEEYNPKVVAKASYYVEGFNAGKESQLQALKEEVWDKIKELNITEDDIQESLHAANHKVIELGAYKEVLNLITNLEDNG